MWAAESNDAMDAQKVGKTTLRKNFSNRPATMTTVKARVDGKE